jgi:dipeptidase E
MGRLRVLSGREVCPITSPDHPESAAVDNIVQYFIEHHMPCVALRDGEAVVVSGDTEEIVS